MNTAVNINKQIWIFLASLLFFSVPAFLFIYVGILVVLIKLFIIFLIIDFIKKTSYRKRIGFVLEPVLFACIISLVVMQFTTR